jgi:hypothetical protein
MCWGSRDSGAGNHPFQSFAGAGSNPFKGPSNPFSMNNAYATPPTTPTANGTNPIGIPNIPQPQPPTPPIMTGGPAPLPTPQEPPIMTGGPAPLPVAQGVPMPPTMDQLGNPLPVTNVPTAATPAVTGAPARTNQSYSADMKKKGHG